MTPLEKPAYQRFDRREIVVLVAILVVASVLRLDQLDAAPPGIIFDIAANVVDAAAIADGERPIFLVGNLGREPLFHYLVALSFSLFGTSITSFRLVAALLGIATVASTYLLARELAGRCAALFAAALLAGSYWHVSLSRIGFRAIAMPLCASLAFWLLWSGWRSGRFARFALGGAFLGLGFYTYIPARLYPVLALLLGLGWLAPRRWREPPGTGRLVFGLAVAAATAVVVAAPITRYFWHHPDDFFGRAQSIGLPAESPQATTALLAESALKTMGLFVVAGDANAHHNLPGRPAFDLLTAPLFLLGVASATWRLRDLRLAFLASWLVLLLLPGALAREAPHYLRTAGVIPAAYILAGLGAAFLVDQLARFALRYWSADRARLSALATVAGLVSVSTAITGYDYFFHWAPSQAAYRASAGDTLDAARLLTDAPGGGERLLGVRTYRGRSGELAVLGAESRARAFDATRTLVIPGDTGEPVWYAFAVGQPETTFDAARLSPLLERGTLVVGLDDPGGVEAAQLYRVEPGALPPIPPERELPAVIGDAVEILGYDLPRRARPGETVTLAVHWRVAGMLTPGRFWQFFAHLADRDREWASDYHEGFEPGQWRFGDRVVSWFDLRIPDSIPTGTYPIEFGLFERETNVRRPIVDGQRQPIGDVLLLGPIRIAELRPDEPTPATPVTFALGESIHLVGFDQSATNVRRSDQLKITLYWRAIDAIPVNFTVFAHLIAPDGRLATQQDSQPQRGSFPTTLWSPDELVRDEYELTVPANAAPGKYTLHIGMYQLETGQRLPIRDSRGKAIGDALPLVAIDVVSE